MCDRNAGAGGERSPARAVSAAAPPSCTKDAAWMASQDDADNSGLSDCAAVFRLGRIDSENTTTIPSQDEPDDAWTDTEGFASTSNAGE